MILYNMRNRGPYEYDKFTLNILQIHNAVTLSEMHELKDNKENKESLLNLQQEINAAIVEKEHLETIASKNEQIIAKFKDLIN